MKKIVLLLLISLFIISLASAQDCSISAKNTDAFLKEIPSLNAKLIDCSPSIPSPMDKLFGNDLINVQVVRNNGTKDTFMITTENSIVTKIENGYSNNPTYVATLAECAFDNVLQSDNKAGALAYLYTNKHLTIGAHGIWRSIVFRIATFFGRGAIRNTAQEIPVTCPKKEVGELCNHGGECETGNCIGIIPGQVYKCSCDPFRYVDADTDGNCPPTPQYPETGQGNPGDNCQHGGQCREGTYCVGVVPGQVYKCSCSQSSYTVIGC